jgi:uncharacterized protein GlcG (DUF336 family)
MPITLDQAQTIVRAAMEHGTEQGFQPLTVAVLDPGGALVALGRQDGSGYLRPDLATAKAWGLLGMGMNNRALAARAEAAPDLYTTLVALSGGKVVSVPGGVLVRDADGQLLGAVGISGDTSLNDEAAALAGIEAAGLTGETGADN